jgi:glycosyltransferase involved in cell wall biosynthesis
MRDILVYEPEGAGHHMYFAAGIAAAITGAGLGPVTLVTTREATQEPAARAVIAAGLDADVETIEPGEEPPPLHYLLPLIRCCTVYRSKVWRGGKLRLQTALGENAERLGRQTAGLVRYFHEAGGADRFRAVFIPYIDKAAFIPLGFWRDPFGDTTFGGIAINPRCHFRAAGIEAKRRRHDDTIEAVSFHRLVRHRRLSALFTADPYFARYLAHPRVHHVPDPSRLAGVPVAGELRRQLGISPAAIVLLIYGELGSLRKAQAEAIEALADPRVPPSVVLVAAGRRNHPHVQSLPEPASSALRAAGRFVEINEFVADETEHALFDAADIVWVCYRDHTAGSNVLTKAGQAGKPVIACRDGLIGRLVRDVDCGVRAAADRHDEIVAALQRLAGDAALRARLGAAGRAAFEGFTFDAFSAPILAWLRSVPS